ncbi:ACP phosphodiesterase [Thermomonas flagellata]|uniref:acyl carrier protein phosphodiesterase n=1 Tax=Thermomonas flagellata TaxID=2888524 RepID=UPI001F043E23|nr:ACP phosphodiesterase [Thermomonas flagellata]
MNYLAHAWLARHSDAAILGALLGDFVRGPPPADAWPAEVRAEILLHRHVDTWTDRHPRIVTLRAGFGPYRRFAGIVLDVYFDHCLARDPAYWQDEPLAAFCRRVYGVLATHRAQLPPRLAALAPRMAAEDWLGGYRRRAQVDAAIIGLAGRLSRHGERLRACLPLLRTQQAMIDRGFDAFFPALCAEVGRVRAGKGSGPHPHDEEP